MAKERASRMDVLALCVNRGGYRAGRRVAQFIAEWELAVRNAGGAINVEGFADYWREHLATSYRRLAEFREMFPELGDRGLPSDLMEPLLHRLATGHAVEGKDVPLVVPT